MMPRIIGVNSNCYHGYSIDEALEGIAAAGFHYVLTATKGWTEHVFPDQSFASLCHVQDKLKELDLVPFAMSGHTNLMDVDRLPDFIMNMRLAHFFGCKYIVSSIGEAHLKDKAKTGNEVLVQNIKGLIPHEPFELFHTPEHDHTKSSNNLLLFVEERDHMCDAGHAVDNM